MSVLFEQAKKISAITEVSQTTQAMLDCVNLRKEGKIEESDLEDLLQMVQDVTVRLTTQATQAECDKPSWERGRFVSPGQPWENSRGAGTTWKFGGNGRNRQSSDGSQADTAATRNRRRCNATHAARRAKGWAVAQPGSRKASAPQARPAPNRIGRGQMKSQVVKRSIVIAGHKTSVSLEDAFWKGLKEIAAMRNIPLSDLVSTIDNERQHGNLSSAIRLFVLDHYRTQAGGVTDIPARDYSSMRTMSPDLRAE